MLAMTIDEIQQKIESLTKKVFEEAGIDLIELKVGGHENDVLIQITADKPSGGITIGECAILNKTLVAAIEQKELLPPEIFSLELSSPGLDRPLITRKDFMRSIGLKLHFWFNGPVGIDGKKEEQGMLAEVGDSSLTITTGGNHKLILPLSSIIKGMLII
jgi:ribosome maturation factor RimP